MLQPTDRVIAKIIAFAIADVALALDSNMDKGSAQTFAKSITQQTKGNPELSNAVWDLIEEVGKEAQAEAEGSAVPNTPHDWID